ncbi:MAG: hypothetical protein WCX65_15720 [bacterium]
MNKRRLLGLFFAVVIMIAAAGCSDDIDKAISMLGDKNKQEEALGIISVSAKDPMPKLLKAMKNKKLSALTRENVALLIGVQCDKTKDDSAVPALVDAMKGAEPSVAKAILEAFDKIPGDKSVKALQDAVNLKNKEVAAEASRILDSRAAALETEADKLTGQAAVKQQIVFLEEAVKINPANKERVKKLATLYSLSGQDGKAKDLLSSGGVFVLAVKALGPLPNDGQDYIDPAKIDFAAPIASPTGVDISWIDLTNIPDSGAIDFRRNASLRNPNSAYYAAFKMNVKSAEKAVLKIYGSDDTISLWLNGKAIISADAFKDQEKAFDAELKSGANLAVLKVYSRRSPRFSIRISGPNDKNISGLSVSL